MRRNMRRFSVGGGLVLLCVLLLMTACSRPKSSGPPEEAVEGETSVADAQSDEEATNATAQALIATTTAQAQTPQPEEQTSPVPEPTAAPVEGTSPPAEPTSVPETEETVPTAEPTAAPTEQAPATSGATSHTVQEGERLFRIALRYGLTYQELAAFNGIANPNLIMVGQVLKLPAAGETTPAPSSGDGHHTVQAGENLFRIALRYGMTFDTLAAANGLNYPYTIYPGQKLVIP
jgi:LysM repeat protein